MAQQTTQKLQYQLKKAESEVEALKRKVKGKGEEFAALQQGVTNKQKILQQRVNRLEQEVLEVKRARDVITKDYQTALKQVIELGKADGEGKAASLAATVESLAASVESLRKDLEASKSAHHDAEERLVKMQAELDLANSERDHHKRERAETEAVAEVLRAQERERRQQEGSAGGVVGGGPKIFSLRGKVILVTGGSRPVGRAICLAAADAGAKVAIVDADEAAAQALQKEIRDLGAEAFVARADPAKAKEVQAAVKQLSDACGAPLDVAVNALPTLDVSTPLATLEEHEWDRAAVSLSKAMLFACQAEHALMKGRNTRIINVLPAAGQSVLVDCTRQSLVGITRSLALEYAASQVRVNSISPGFFALEKGATDKRTDTIPDKTLCCVDDLVGAALFLASDPAAHLTAQNICIDGGFSAN